MKKGLWINGGLLAAVVLLGLIVWLKPAGRDADHKLSTLKAAEVKSLEIAMAGAPPIALARVADGLENQRAVCRARRQLSGAAPARPA